ncbi:nucleoside kinase [Alistipes putredinis]|jgi:uridine kinase|uniref:AAA family ATPase n=3 Tax=Alistipes putredinis TaxID=28117 RepID=A0A1Q6F5M0_9BACT|nr:nucleoside kinase [Alistipes putredinis]MBP8652508.1 nucleoside kinase [Alistipes sp.]MCB7351453.1 nucleoside kinase [Alistipes putredinis]MCG4721431.1 nucleoside kinase [Alistipes putredinis]MCQ5064368.1 nucleoside kinase [Alistipes putredinis]MCQ5076617.1 nucleoside kinase [Alistipes putredinis]
MSDTLPVICENAGRTIEVAMGTTLLEVERQLRLDGPHPFLAAYVNNRIKELNYRIYKPVTVRFIDITSFEGIRVYQRTISFILQKAVRELFPDRTLYIRHSLGASGFYCEISGFGPIPAEHLDAIKARMRGIIDRNLPIQGVKMLTDTARKIYEGFGMADKIALLDSRPRLYSKIYTIDSLPGYFYGALTPSTGYTPQFDLHPYYNGFFIALPLRTDPTRLHQSVHQEKMFDVFHQYQSWVEIMGVPTVGQLNSKVLAGDASELIKIAEAFHENKLAQVAGCVAEANRERGVRLVLISGPSSSGKTTFAKRLGVQLRVLGLNPVLISLDDYFVDREKTPRDENGEYDYEALEAIDLEQFNDHLKRLERGESVDIPRYDFISGTRQWHDNPLQLDERSVLIVEGIHGLNPALTPGVPESRKFKIYVSCFTSVALDNVSRIATSDNRLLRRLTRDYRTRGNDALSTLARWESVRRGEEKHIFPYQENADVMFNSSLFYEISVLRRFAEPILREVPDTVPEYGEAKRMLKFLDNFIPISPEEIPPTSLLREFIGGSSFKY